VVSEVCELEGGLGGAPAAPACAKAPAGAVRRAANTTLIEDRNGDVDRMVSPLEDKVGNNIACSQYRAKKAGLERGERKMHGTVPPIGKETHRYFRLARVFH
jgi:hypothetical protein